MTVGLPRALRLEQGVVTGELQADADVVLHAPHLAGQGYKVLLEGGGAHLELVGVDLHLLAQAET